MADNTEIESKEPFYTNSDNFKENTNNFSSEYSGEESIDMPKGSDETEDPSTGNVSKLKEPLKGNRSNFNKYNVVRIKNLKDNSNYPINDEESAQQKELYENVTATTLINNPKGASIYRTEDFLYCAKFGRVKNNRLITLRRFAFPVFDDIFSSNQTEPDVGRLLTYFDQEVNKLEDLMTFTCGMRWKELKSSFEQANVLGSQDGVSGFMRHALSVIDPKFGKEALRNPNELNYDPLVDSNRVFGPVDSIDKMQIRDVGLNFEQDMILTFNYKMKSINGVNQKTAFLDLISNILLVCHNDAKFWGGARYWVGPKPTKYMNKLKSLSSKPKDFTEFLRQGAVDLKGIAGEVSGQSDSPKSTLSQIASNFGNLAIGKIMNTIGRPAIPSMNSLLTGSPTGLWHLTIGNPLNPIMCAGDLIMTGTTFKFGNDLGYDDFPTELTVEITLKHNKPKGRAEIESMFNAGKGRIYWKPEEVFNKIKPKGTKTSPSNVHDTEPNIESMFGDFSNSQVLSNENAVWSFINKNKK